MACSQKLEARHLTEGLVARLQGKFLVKICLLLKVCEICSIPRQQIVISEGTVEEHNFKPERDAKIVF